MNVITGPEYFWRSTQTGMGWAQFLEDSISTREFESLFSQKDPDLWFESFHASND